MVKRELLRDLKDHLSKEEMSLIVGPRQAGKTTLMFMLKDFLESQGQKTLYFNLDFEADRPFFQSQKALIQKIELELGKEKSFVFIDEIQRKEDAGLFLKGLYDYHLPCKFIISGSGSLELKEKIHESLLGRKRIFEVETLSFKEFLHFKTDYRYEEKLEAFFNLEKEKTKEFLEEYLSFGGYPRIVLEATLKEKKKIMEEIFQTLLEKDISYLLKVEKVETFSTMIQILAGQIGQILNVTELSSTLGSAQATIQNYLWYAQKTFILEKLTPYFRNPRTELIKSPIFYFHDLGLRNFALGLFGNLPLGAGRGFIFQNFVFRLLKEKFPLDLVKLYFWRTKDKAEVDFILGKGQEIIPVEVKYQEMKKPEIERSLRNFLIRYNPTQAWVINLTYEDKVKIGETEVLFLPFHALLNF